MRDPLAHPARELERIAVGDVGSAIPTSASRRTASRVAGARRERAAAWSRRASSMCSPHAQQRD